MPDEPPLLRSSFRCVRAFLIFFLLKCQFWDEFEGAKRGRFVNVFQRVWRRYRVTKMVALELREGWEKCVNQEAGLVITATWISSNLVRPFLFFITCLSIRHRSIKATEVDSMKNCFQMLLESMNSTGMVLISFLLG